MFRPSNFQQFSPLALKPGKTPKELVLAGAAIGLASIVFYGYKRLVQKNDGVVPDTTNLEALSDRLKQVQILARKEQMAPFLSISLIAAIENLIVESCSKEYKKMVTHEREKRRAFFRKDNLAYENCIIEGFARIQNLIQGHTEFILNKLGIEMSKFIRSMESVEDLNSSSIFRTRKNAVNLLRKELVDSSYRLLTQRSILKAIVFALDEYPLYKPHNPTFRRLIKDAYLEDSLQETFKCEEEAIILAGEHKGTSCEEIHAGLVALEKLKEDESDPNRFSNESLLVNGKFSKKGLAKRN